MLRTLALSPDFAKGIAVTICSVILFIGSVYIFLGSIFGLRMGYLVLAVSLFGWMIVLSALWVFGAPGTPAHLGPRGTEPHWQVFAAGTGIVKSTEYRQTATFPTAPWRPAGQGQTGEIDVVKATFQEYLAHAAQQQLAQAGEQGGELDPNSFTVQDIAFATVDGTRLAGGHAFFGAGGPQITVFAYADRGNVPVYSYAFLGASILGFIIHLPFLDRAERKRKALLTGGTAPAWYGPA